MPSTPDDGPLHGLHILVVEDDVIQADEICLCITDAGAIVIGPVGKFDDVVKLIAMNNIHVATIDINLGDGPSFEVAGHLLAANVPFLFVTGYDCRTMPQKFAHVSCLDKPFSEEHLLRSLASIARGALPRVSASAAR
jgi:two-component SAPR family response regulator